MTPRQPVYAWISAKERTLPFGQRHRRSNRGGPALLQCLLTGNYRQQLPVPDRLRCQEPQASPQVCDLIQQTGLEHPIEPLLNAFRKCLLRVEPDGYERQHRFVVSNRCCPRRCRTLRRRQARETLDLQRTYNTPRIGEIDVFTGVGVDIFEHLPARLDREIVQALAELGVIRWELERIDNRTEVQTRASTDHGDDASFAEVCDDASRRPLKLGDRHVLTRIGDIYEVMRDPFPHRRARFRRPDVHTAVHLHRVNGNDLTAASGGDLNRQCRLPRRGGTDDGDRSQDASLPSR